MRRNGSLAESVRTLIQEYGAVVRSEVAEYLRHRKRQQLVGAEAINCQRHSMRAGERVVKVLQLPCVRWQGAVAFRGKPLFSGNGGDFHEWLEVPGFYSIIDFTLAYHIWARAVNPSQRLPRTTVLAHPWQPGAASQVAIKAVSYRAHRHHQLTNSGGYWR